MPKQRTKEQNREYMREYMRRQRRSGREVRDVGERRPIVLALASYSDITAAVLGDPPIGRRALDPEHRP